MDLKTIRMLSIEGREHILTPHSLYAKSYTPFVYTSRLVACISQNRGSMLDACHIGGVYID